MKIQSFTVADAMFEKSPGQAEDIFTADLVDERHGGPVTVGYGRYEAGTSLTETMAVDDVMVILEGRLSIISASGTAEVGPGAIVHMPKGEEVTIRAHDEGVLTAYVTYPHWRQGRD